VNTLSICEVFFDISSMIYRNLLSMTTEELIARHPFDGVVLLGGCDKVIPAQVDYESFRNLVRTLIRGGCQAVTLFGIAGEYYKLSEEESDELVKITVEECRSLKGISIISVTQHATELAVKRAKYYEDAGADMLMLLPPFFLKPGADALYQHMKAVGQAVRIPVMAQYAPEQTGVAIAPAMFARLFNEVPNINYYKIECRPAGLYISTLLKETENRIGVFIGNAGYQFIEGFDRGAVGVMPGASMFDIYRSGCMRRFASPDKGFAQQRPGLAKCGVGFAWE
jgi:4-hydroxy-tetrahydrodipicolinate synthase